MNSAVPEDLRALQAVLRQLTEMWSVLETLTPSEYMEFRHILGPSSGFQSLQYRTMEFLLGNKNAAMLKVFAHDAQGCDVLRAALESPSLYDEALAYLARHGHPYRRMRCSATGPSRTCSIRPWCRCSNASTRTATPIGSHTSSARTWSTWKRSSSCGASGTCVPVMRIIGFKRGTGGSSGVGFLKQALELTFFPELFEVRTVIGATPSAGY
jgi:tryptophan 2,3-dioxygenase